MWIAFQSFLDVKEANMIEITGLENTEKWDAIVRSFKNYDVFYLSFYVKDFAKEEKVTHLLFYYDENGKRLINVVMKRDIAEDEHFKGKIETGRYFDLVTPYGYGGFLSEDGFPDNLYDKYEKFCRDNGFICEFVRFELFTGYEKYYGGEIECRTHNVVRDLQISIDDMFMDFEHKVRKNIKKAVRNELNILVEQNIEHIDDFLNIYYGTMKRSEAEESFYFSKEFFETLGQMKENVVFFYVIYKDKIIAAELVIYGSENAYSYLGGTDNNYFELRPNDFLKFEAIKWLKEKGLKNFVLGGGYGVDDGIFRYKKSFAPDGIVDFHIGRKIFDKATYQKLIDMREEVNPESKFFPLYRS